MVDVKAGIGLDGYCSRLTRLLLDEIEGERERLFSNSTTRVGGHERGRLRVQQAVAI